MDRNKALESARLGMLALGITSLGIGGAMAGTSSAGAIKRDPKPPIMTAAIIRNRTLIYTKGWVKCYGINAADRNTCHTATINCGTNAPRNDPDAFVAVPKGLCTRIAGGSLTPSIAIEAAKADGMPLPQRASGNAS